MVGVYLVAPKLSWDRGLQHAIFLTGAVSHYVVLRALGVITRPCRMLLEKSRRAPLWGRFDKQALLGVYLFRQR